MSKACFNIQGKLKQGVESVSSSLSRLFLEGTKLDSLGPVKYSLQQEKEGKKHQHPHPHLADEAASSNYFIYIYTHTHLMEVARCPQLYFSYHSLYISQQSLSHSTKITMWLHSIFLLVNNYSEYM